jgi:hypothetical protein
MFASPYVRGVEHWPDSAGAQVHPILSRRRRLMMIMIMEEEVVNDHDHDDDDDDRWARPRAASSTCIG